MSSLVQKVRIRDGMFSIPMSRVHRGRRRQNALTQQCDTADGTTKR